MKGYYHRNSHEVDDSKGSMADHVFSKFMTFTDFVVEPDLPLSYLSKGEGMESFRTSYEAKFSHHLKCGTATFTDGIIPLALRSAQEGCGLVWYRCDGRNSGNVSRHNLLTCKKTYTDRNGHSETCGFSYWDCMYHSRDHNESDLIPLKGSHSNEVDSTEETTSNNLQTPPPTPSTPTYHACGTHETTVSGNHESADCDTSGHYVCDGSSHVAAICGTTGHYKCDSVSVIVKIIPCWYLALG